MDATLWRVSQQLYDSMVRGSFESLLNWFATFNFSPERLAAVSDRFDATRRTNAAANDVYAIQNLMESLKTFKGFTAELGNIICPTLILNGEHDGLTPRRLHEPLRLRIANSRLMLIQHGYHAFSMELPEIVERVVVDFIAQVEAGHWVGDQTVWVAEDSPTAPRLAFPCPGDHRRGIPVLTPVGPPPPARYSPLAPPS
jgi:pimeloyl-ACP methyl ester carboxylesterase